MKINQVNTQTKTIVVLSERSWFFNPHGEGEIHMKCKDGEYDCPNLHMEGHRFSSHDRMINQKSRRIQRRGSHR